MSFNRFSIFFPSYPLSLRIYNVQCACRLSRVGCCLRFSNPPIAITFAECIPWAFCVLLFSVTIMMHVVLINALTFVRIKHRCPVEVARSICFTQEQLCALARSARIVRTCFSSLCFFSPALHVPVQTLKCARCIPLMNHPGWQ